MIKKIKLSLLALALSLSLSSCMTVSTNIVGKSDNEDISVDKMNAQHPFFIPMYDMGLTLSENGGSYGNDYIPNITKEQGDEIFGNISVYGYNLTLPMRVTDLPSGVKVEGSSFLYDSTNISMGVDFTYTDLAINDGDTERSISADIIYADKDDASSGIIIKYGLFFYDAGFQTYIDGYKMFDTIQAFREKYGDASIYRPSDVQYEKYDMVYYFDGVRLLRLIGHASDPDDINTMIPIGIEIMCFNDLLVSN